MTTGNLTIQDNDTVDQYTSVGDTVFVFNFPILAADELKVSINQVLLTYGTDYSIAGLGDDGGGTITMLAGPTTPGDIITLWQDMPIERLTGFSPGAAALMPEALNADFARAARVEQQLRREIRNSLRIAPDDPVGGQDMVLPIFQSRANKYLGFDADSLIALLSGTGNDAALRTDLANIAIGNSLVAQKITAAEFAAGVTPQFPTIDPYKRGRYFTFTDWRLACDQAGVEGVLDADYALAADTYLPLFCDYKGFKTTGNFKTIHAYRNGGYVRGWRASQQTIIGCYYGEYDGITNLGGAGNKLRIVGGDGVGANAGCFWNKIFIKGLDHLEIDADHHDINFNSFYGGVPRFIHLIGGGVGIGQIHANKYFMCDVSDYGDLHLAPNSGYLQEDALRSKNFFDGLYYENGSQIRGNVSIHGMQGDSNSGMPLVDKGNHILDTVGLNPRVANDFLAAGSHNLARGGLWDWLDIAGKPKCFDHFGGAGIAIFAATDEPGGNGKRYEATFAAAFGRFDLTIQPQSGSSHTAVVIYYKGTQNYTNIESNYAGAPAATAFGTEPVVVRDSAGLPTDWKLLRLSCPASATVPLVVSLFAHAAVPGAPKTFSLGSVRANAEKACLAPTRNDESGFGIYTPVRTIVANLDAATTGPANYTRTQGGVLVTGEMTVDPTAGATLTRVRITLPPDLQPTAFTATADASGTLASGTVVEAGRCFADIVNNTQVELSFISAGAALHTIGYSFTYRL